MMAQRRPLPLRVAVIGTNDPRNFSGGRYHAAILAFAVAAAGGEAHIITDHSPAFLADLEPLAPRRVRVSVTKDFRQGLPPGDFDWVIIVPTGIFLPQFYEAALSLAAERKARIGLVNFESANWFNAEAPEPRDPRLWDYWRRSVGRGGLVLSSTRTSDAWARDFYHALDGQLRFEFWRPPINSAAFRRFDGLPKDGSILCFVRPTDAHKGSALLTALPPAVLAGRTLRLVAGVDTPDAFRAEVAALVAAAPGARVEFLSRISDIHKARLLTQAQALLFPTRFEGFGYPAVEAAYAGTESVCFPLPVLRETVGPVAHFAADFNPAAFSQALAVALARPERRAELRQAVFAFADFDEAAFLLADILLRSAPALTAHQRKPFSVPIGPFHRARPLPAEAVDRKAGFARHPPTVLSARRGSAGDTLLSLAWDPPAPFDRLEARGPEDQHVLAVAEERSAGPRRAHLVLPGDMLGVPIRLRALAGEQLVDEVLLWPNAVMPADPHLGARSGISEQRETRQGLLVRGWILAAQPIRKVLVSGDGTAWIAADVTGERRDVLAKHQGYPTARMEFRVTLPTGGPPDPQRARILALGDDGLVELLSGWPPAPRSSYAAGIARLPPLREEPGPAGPIGVAPEVPPQRRLLGVLELAAVNDAEFRQGVLRQGKAGLLGAILARSLPEGFAQHSVLRFAGGEVRRIRAMEARGKTHLLHLDGPVSPSWSGHPSKVEAFAAEDPELSRALPGFSLSSHTDRRWRRGVWDMEDDRKRRLFFMPASEARALGLTAGRELIFAKSGSRVIERVIWSDRNANILLDRPIDPDGDGQPARVLVPRSEAELKLDAVDLEVALAVAPDQTAIGTAFLEGAQLPGPGAILLSESGEGLRVVAVQPEATAPLLLLNRRLAGSSRRLRMVAKLDLPDGIAEDWIHPEAEFPARDPLYQRLMGRAARMGEGIAPSPSGPAAGRRRILVISLVSPAPANQGNRVVTRNLVRHWLELGFEVDLLVQNWMDSAAMTAMFDSRVRTFAVAFPDWRKSPAMALRASLAQAVSTPGSAAADPALSRELADKLDIFDPFFILRDETVRRAEGLLAVEDYAAIICNYTHCLRVVAELARWRPLPPVAVFTHDALSRLPRSFEGKRLETGYRLASAAGERAALDALPGAIIVAISRSEAEYFRQIGVTNPVVLCEYDAWEETEGRRVDRTGFAARRLIFPGSGNPMNVAGMAWFLEHCWPSIHRAVPGARLTLCGSVCGALGLEADSASGARGIEVLGDVERDALLGLMARSSLLINPCVAGTGLKIKTVEAAASGLPVVCLPSAVDGLENAAAGFALVTEAPAEFTQACIALLTDEALWLSLHEGALALAEARFSSRAVYHALDAALALDKPAPPPGPGYDAARPFPSLAEAATRLEWDPLDGKALLVLAAQLIRSRQPNLGWSIVREVHRREPADAVLAAFAAQLAIQAGEPWEAVLLGARLAAGSPANPEAYRLMGLGLLDGAQPDEAIAALEQAVLLAPDEAALIEALGRALSLRGRPEEARLWAGRISRAPAFGEYVEMSQKHIPPELRSGWLPGEAACLAPGRQARFRVRPPHGAAGMVWLEMDLAVPAEAELPTIMVSLAGASRRAHPKGRGAVRTLVASIGLGGLRAGHLEIGLALPKPVATVRLLGFTLHAEPPASLLFPGAAANLEIGDI